MLFVLLLATIAFATCYPGDVSRTIPQGKLIGKLGLDRKGNVYHSFLSIPYAKPPLGDLRFSDPIEANAWTGVLNATVGHAVCPQRLERKNVGEEDCLYLNVHTPENKRCTKYPKPVIAFIHGGAFIEGTGQEFGPEFLMPECVLLVTMNYRLGLLGFLNSDDASLGIPGNAGMKDQVMALRWIQKNIRFFGGNPANVMIIGESAGSVSVHLHMLSPLSRGLFHKVVAMSGTAETAWAFGLRNTLEIVGKRKGVNSKVSRDTLAALRRLSKDEILDAQENYTVAIPIHKPFECSPSQEPKSSGAFLSSRPLDTINSGNYSAVPLMIGYTNKDGVIVDIIHRLESGSRRIITDFTEMIPYNINHTGLDLNAIAQDIKEFYFGSEGPDLSDLETFSDLFTGAWIISALPLVIKAHVRQKKAPVYLYRFSVDTELNYVKHQTPETSHYKGTIHSEDLSYIFKTIHTPLLIAPNSKEDIAIDNVVKLIKNFAIFNYPSKYWMHVTKKTYHYMEIGIRPVPGINPDRKQFAFWDAFYEKYL